MALQVTRLYFHFMMISMYEDIRDIKWKVHAFSSHRTVIHSTNLFPNQVKCYCILINHKN